MNAVNYQPTDRRAAANAVRMTRRLGLPLRAARAYASWLSLSVAGFGDAAAVGATAFKLDISERLASFYIAGGVKTNDRAWAAMAA